MAHFVSKAIFDDGWEERLLIENWPLIDALAEYQEARVRRRTPPDDPEPSEKGVA